MDKNDWDRDPSMESGSAPRDLGEGDRSEQITNREVELQTEGNLGNERNRNRPDTEGGKARKKRNR